MAYEKGFYLCRVKGQGFGELPNDKKTPYFFLAFSPFAIVDPLQEGHPIIENISSDYDRDVKLYISEKAAEFTIERLRNLGWIGASFRELDPDLPSSHSFVGMDIELICSHRQSGDKVYDQWDFPGMGGGSTVENTAGLSRKLDTLFGKQLKKTAAAKPATVKSAIEDAVSAKPDLETVPPHGNPPPNDDVPF